MNQVVRTLGLGCVLPVFSELAIATPQGPPQIPGNVGFNPKGQPKPYKGTPPEIVANVPELLYRGTYIDANENLAVPKGLKQAIAASLAEREESPAERWDHFSWLKDRKLHITGWNGSITHIYDIQGGQLIEIAFSPQLIDLHGHHGRVRSTFTEYYIVHQDGIHYLLGHGENDRGNRLVYFP